MGVLQSSLFRPNNKLSNMKCVILAALVAAAMAAPRPDGPPAYGPPAPYHAPAKLPPQPFAYQYGVADDYSGANYEGREPRCQWQPSRFIPCQPSRRSRSNRHL